MLAAVATNRDLRKMVSVSSPLSQLTAHHTNTAQLFSLARFTCCHCCLFWDCNGGFGRKCLEKTTVSHCMGLILCKIVPK